MEHTKRPALLLVAQVLQEEAVPYAVIGGVALQVHHPDPRTTLDIDLAVLNVAQLPRTQLEDRGFRFVGRFQHSENWMGPDETPVQFTDDPALAGAINRADSIELDGVSLRVIQRADLLRDKLRAGSDPARRPSKRLQDLADAQALVEADLTLTTELTAGERQILQRVVEPFDRELSGEVGEPQSLATHATRVADAIEHVAALRRRGATYREIAEYLQGAGIIVTRLLQPQQYKQQATPYVQSARWSYPDLMTKREARIYKRHRGAEVEIGGRRKKFRTPVEALREAGVSWSAVQRAFGGLYLER